MCTQRSRKVIICDMINALFLTLQLSNLLLLLSLAFANTRPWPLVPFFQISLKNIELKTTYNTFRDCRMHFFRRPFSKQLYTTSPPGLPWDEVGSYFMGLCKGSNVLGNSITTHFCKKASQFLSQRCTFGCLQPSCHLCLLFHGNKIQAKRKLKYALAFSYITLGKQAVRMLNDAIYNAMIIFRLKVLNNNFKMCHTRQDRCIPTGNNI